MGLVCGEFLKMHGRDRPTRMGLGGWGMVQRSKQSKILPGYMFGSVGNRMVWFLARVGGGKDFYIYEVWSKIPCIATIVSVQVM